MIFYTLTSAWPLGSCCNPEVNVSENMFDRYYCIKSFCCLKTLEKMLRKTGFLLYNNGQQKHERCIEFKNASFRAKTYAILVSLSYANFYAC